MRSLDTTRPVLLLGGGASTLAAARSLGGAGIPIYASGRSGLSRHAFAVLQIVAANSQRQ